MNLKQALYIQTIAQEGGVTAAAKKLYISQPSLSQMLRQIETELGLPLFERSVSPLRPTYAGERYLHAASVMLAAQEILDNELQQIRQEDSGRLRLGISMQRGAHILPQVLPRFSKAYPQVAVELQEAGSARLEELVREGRTDLALASTEPVGDGLTYQLIQQETVGLLTGADSPLAAVLPSGSAIHLAQAGKEPFVSLKPGHNFRVIQDQLFRTQGLHPPIFLETDSMETALRVTRSSPCCMLCSNSHTAPQDHFYPLLDYENHRHFYACFRTGEPIPRYTQSFLKMTAEHLKPL